MIQSAEEFITKIRHMIPMLGPRGGVIGWKVEIDNTDAAALIRSRDKAIVEACKSSILRDHPQWDAVAARLDFVLREISK